MSFSISRRTRHKIVGCLIGGVLGLAGCSSVPSGQGSVEDDESAELASLFEDFDETPGQSTVSGEIPSPPSSAEDSDSPLPLATPSKDVSFLDEIEGIVEGQELESDVSKNVSEAPIILSAVNLSDWEVIRGGTIGNALTGIVDTSFQRPVAVAARGEYVYVVDADLRSVLRYDRASGRLESVLDLNGVVQGEVADIYVNADFSFYLADPEGARVLLFDRSGRLLQTFQNRLNMARPVALVVLDDGHIVVADGYYDYLVRFNEAGTMVATYSGRGLDAGDFLNILTMAIGPDGYYVGARVGRKIQVVSLEGVYRYSFEEGAALFPSAIVVDSENRSYVSDYMDDRIKVFDRGRLVATLGRHGVGPGQFQRITDLWLDDQFLYIADSLNGRIQIARIAAQRAAIPLSR